MSGLDANVVLLLHCDGADGSTSFPDSSDSAHTVTANGNAQVDTAQSKFGGASLLLDGTGDFLSSADSAVWEIANSDFTIDLWIRGAEFSGFRGLVSHYADPGGIDHGWVFSLNGSTVLQFDLWNTGVLSGRFSATVALSINTQYHVAVERDDSTLNFYLDGIKLTTVIVEALGTASAADNTLNIGRIGTLTANDFNGHIDEVRISTVARYQGSNFAPPTEAYSDSADPFLQTDWPLPNGARPHSNDLRTWVNSGALLLFLSVPVAVGGGFGAWGELAWGEVETAPPVAVPKPFLQSDWPVPKAPDRNEPELRTWAHSTPLTLIGQDQFFGVGGPSYDYPNPRGPARSSTLEQLFNPGLTVATVKPFSQSEWPLPITPQRASDLRTWIDQSSNLLEVSVAFSQSDWPVPKGYEHPIVLRTWTDHLKLNLQGQDALPFFQREWPVFRPVPIPVSDWVVGQSLPVRAIPVIHLGPGFVEHAPTFAPVEPPPPKRHRVERELDRKHLRRIIERAYAAQQQPVEQIVAYLTQLALEGHIMPADYLALLYAQLPRDLIDVDALIAMVEQEIIARRIEIEERDMEAILLALGDL